MDVANLDIRANSSSVKTASANLATFGSKAGLASRAMRVLAPVMAAALSAKVFSGLAGQANQFSSALAEVSTLLNDTAKDMPLLTQNAKLLAAQFGGQPTDQVKAFYQAISAGAGGAEEATKLLTAANKLAIGGVTDVTTAVDGLTTIVNSFGLETADATRVSDALFVAMKAGKTTVGELSGGVGKVAALASTAGLSFEEMLGSVSALTTGGIATNEAVTGLKAALTNILKPSSDAAKTAEALGLEFDMQSLQAKGLQGFLKDLVKQTGGNQKAMLKLFGSTEALNTVFALTGGSAEAFDDVMTNMGTSLGQTETAFKKVSITMTHQLNILKGKFAATAIELGDFVVAATKPVVQHLNENFDAYKAYFKDISKAFTNSASGIIKIWKPLFSFIADGFKDVFNFIAKLLTPFLKAFISLVTAITKAYATFFSGLVIGAEKALREFVNTFKNGFIKVKEFIDTTKVSIVGFYDLMKIKGESFFDSAKETERKLLAMDVARKESLDLITKAYDNERKELVLVDTQVSRSTEFYKMMGGTLSSVTDLVNDLGSATFSLGNDLVDVEAKTARFDAGAIAASTSVGIFKNQVVATDNSVKLLDIDLTSMSKPTGTFRMVTEEMSAMSIANTETNAKLLEMEEASGKAGTGVAALTVEQQTFTTAVENTQTAFATLIKDTITSGKLNFSSFFKSVKEGWKTMIAEFMSKKIMDAIFGQGGLTGFLSSLSGGFGSIISGITSGLGSLVSSFASSMTALAASAVSAVTGNVAGNVADGATGGAAASAAGGATLGGVVAGAGQFVAGMTGSATGIAAGTMGPPTAAAMAGSGVTAGLQAGGAKLVALATNPVTIAIVAAAAAAKLLDDSGTMSGNAGLITDKSIDLGNRAFHVDEFASGAQFRGFNRREDQATANSIVESFATLDSALTEAALAVGITPNLNAASFVGSSETGRGVGAFFGSANEDGSVKSASLQSQLDSYATQWINMVGSANGVDPAVIADVIGGGTAAGILERTKPDGSLASGINRIPFDGFRAELHEGERVQSVAEVKRADLMATEMANMRGNLNELMLVVAKAVTKTARIESRWDINGLPPTRT